MLPRDRVALVLGVLGEGPIAPAHEAPIRDRIETVLDELASRFGSTPLLVLSALTPGAELIGAEVAAGRGIPVIACLGAPAEACEAELAAEDGERFRRVLARCARVDVLAEPAATFVANTSHLVVEVSGGGTVFHFPTDADGARFRHDDSERDFWASIARLDRYNADMRATERRRGPFDASIEGFGARTDAAANSLQKQTLTSLLILYFFALLATALQVGLEGRIGEVLKLTTMALAFGAFLLTLRRDAENRYQDYRALSEGLRVQSVWLHTGLPVDRVERSYLRTQQAELQWIRLALRYARLAYLGTADPAEASTDHPAWKNWVRGQWRYYYSAARREAAKLRFFRRLTAAAFILAFAATVAGIVLSFPTLTLGGGWTQALRGWSDAFAHPDLIPVLATAPLAIVSAFAILVEHFCYKRGYETNVKRYQRMFIVFDRARRTLQLIQMQRTQGDPRAIVRELGEAALVEHADWLLTSRERPWSFVGG